MTVAARPLTYDERIAALHRTKLDQTRAKQALGPLDSDDKGRVLPPEGYSFTPPVVTNSAGGFFGARACGSNFRAFMEAQPVYVDPMSSLAGAWRDRLIDYRKQGWPSAPEFDFSHLHPEQKLYNIYPGIGAVQHFCPDVRIGLDLGWGGILARIRASREKIAPERREFLDALEDVVIGVQDWIGRHAVAARDAAEREDDPILRRDLEIMADMCARQVTDPPKTFREACQWIAWMEMVVSIYNHSGALGAADVILGPFYERDVAAGFMDDEEATFHLACLLLKETHYWQIGGPDPKTGADVTNRVSFLVLEAAHRLKIPANIAVRVHDGIDADLFDLSVRYLFEDRKGTPNYMGADGLDEGFAKNGYPVEIARERWKSGCHWNAIPGREYTMNDVVKINLAAVFDAALRDMMSDAGAQPSVGELWRRYEAHLRRAVEVTAQGIDFHLAHMKDVFPELALDLFCHGTIEKGRDATDGGVEFYNMCIDGAALATAADSFAAVEQRVEREKRMSWADLLHALDTDYADAPDVRRMLRSVPRFGTGGTRADEFARRVSETFVRLVKEKPTPSGFNLIPGLFSWASTIPMGRMVGATPNGRHAGAPISHGPNPDPGVFAPNSPTAMSRAVTSVECGWGNTAPLQLDLDPGTGRSEESRHKVGALLRAHFDMGGTMININVLDRRQIVEAHADPTKFPDLVVRVTGFSAYFASLSKEFRQLVVDRMVNADA